MIVISVFNSNKDLEEYTFAKTKKTISIGRSNDCDVMINDEHISRKHLEIKFEEDQTFIKDVTLSNWISYNNEKLSKSEDTLYYDFAPLLLPGDFEVKIGNERRRKSTLRDKIEASSQGQKTIKTVVNKGKKNQKAKKPKKSINAKTPSSATTDKNKIYLLIMLLIVVAAFFLLD